MLLNPLPLLALGDISFHRQLLLAESEIFTKNIYKVTAVLLLEE